MMSPLGGSVGMSGALFVFAAGAPPRAPAEVARSCHAVVKFRLKARGGKAPLMRRIYLSRAHVLR